MSLQTTNSPFDQQQVELLNKLVPTLAREQAAWLCGYLTAVGSATNGSATNGSPLAAAQTAPAAAIPAGPAAQTAEAMEVTVLFGSQTGNAAGLAKELSRRLQQRGFQTTLSCMSQYKPRNLKKVKYLLVVVSTHGEGDPPDKAVQFHEFLHGKRAPKLDGVRFSVLALGDLSYEQFCQTGREIDQRLEELGAERLYERTDCDVAYDEPAEAWMEGVVAALCRETEASGKAAPNVATLGATAAAPQPAAEPAYSRTRPFPAEVLENLNLNGRGSDKETRHLELSIEGSGLEFKPGDSLGIYPENDPRLVDTLIGEMHWNGEDLVAVGKQERPLREALLRDYEITVLTRPLVKQAAGFSQNGLADLVLPENEERLGAYLSGRDVLDLVRDSSLSGVPARDFVGILRRMPPRLYSIASSYTANPEEVHLTVAAVRYHAHNRDRGGVCSVQCAERVRPGDTLPVYVNGNPNFFMPPDPDAAIIMVGPGTGVAPFRAFLEEREETGATGKSWLFFGDRRFRTDFLYQVEWQRWLKGGVLTRMDVAFSRDTDRKVYVQHRMEEQGRDLFAWLEEGAYFYVCGDEKRMAPDVHATLEKIVEREGGMSADAARAYVAELRQQGRYQRDVY